MRFRGFILAFGLALSLSLGNADFIRAFDAQMTLLPDSRFIVTETITVDFGEAQRHGIYRRIPVLYERDADLGIARVPTGYAIRLRLGAITDEQGTPYQKKVSRDGRYLMIRIGDPDVYVTGVHVYRITYEVTRAINYFKDQDEFYWNVTGNEWEYPIYSVLCTVSLPSGVNASQVHYRTFTGVYGSRTSHAKTTLSGNVFMASTGTLQAGEGLTVVLGLPKGVLRQPSTLQQLGWFLVDNSLLIGMFLMPFIAFFIMLTLYLKHGRDPEAGLPIAVQYDPPPNLTPAEVGTLVDERADVSDIVSTVLDLAVRGYLKIREMETKVLLFFSNKDYEFIKLKEPDDQLEPHEQKFMRALFDYHRESVLLSELKNKFYVHLPDLRDRLYRQLVDKGLFPVSPEQVRNTYLGVGIAAVVIPFVIGFFAVQTSLADLLVSVAAPTILLSAGVSLVLSGLIVWGIGRAMPRKTVLGSRAARHALGFKEFVERVEKDRIERMVKDDPTIFERLLPFAVVLGVADEWAEKFKDLVTQPPSWYEGSYYPGRFYLTDFVNDLGRGMNAMGSTLTSKPSGSGGGGGGFSGFGGGGFSGGGFGGGGGGSW